MNLQSDEDRDDERADLRAEDRAERAYIADMSGDPRDPEWSGHKWEARLEEAREKAEAAVAKTFIGAVTSGGNPSLSYPSRKSTAPIISHLLDCGDDAAALLLEACRLAKEGKYEASTKQLLAFVDRAANDYAASVVEWGMYQ